MKTIAKCLILAGIFVCPPLSAQEITLLTTVLRVVNIPMITGLRLLEKEDGIKVAVKELRTPEAVVLAVIDGQGQIGQGFAPFYPAVEKGAPIRAVMELSRPEFVISARQDLKTPEALNGVRLASHSPKSTVQSLLEFYFKAHPAIKPNIVFIPEGSPARASALLRGAVDAAAFDLSSAKTLQDSAPGKFHVLVDFTTQPLSSSVLFFNPAFARANPDVVRKTVLRQWAAWVPISFNFPTPWQTVVALAELLGSGALLQASATSLQSLVLGFGAAILIGVPLGLLMGVVRGVGRVARVYLDLLIALPSAALIPLVILSFGISIVSSAV